MGDCIVFSSGIQPDEIYLNLPGIFQGFNSLQLGVRGLVLKAGQGQESKAESYSVCWVTSRVLEISLMSHNQDLVRWSDQFMAWIVPSLGLPGFK